LYRKIKCVSVVPNLCDTRPSVAEPKRRRTVILWVGRADPWKRGEAFVELARRFPDRSFVMVCSVTENRVYGDALVAMAERVPNLELHMGLKTEALLPLYDVSELLVNTSYSEGVSNAMLEAMSAGCAILSSMTNPDNVLTREGVGWCADSLDDDSLAALFAQVSANAEILSAAGKRASEYVRCNHGRDVVATAFAAVVTSASKKRRRSRCLKFAAKGR
jgi:glycosyltransferase involved in cell wall biosynthesis